MSRKDLPRNKLRSLRLRRGTEVTENSMEPVKIFRTGRVGGFVGGGLTIEYCLQINCQSGGSEIYYRVLVNFS